MSKPTTVDGILDKIHGDLFRSDRVLYGKDEAKAALASVILPCVPEEKKTQGEVFAIPDGISNMGASYYHTQGFNACREQVLKNLKEVLG